MRWERRRALIVVGLALAAVPACSGSGTEGANAPVTVAVAPADAGVAPVDGPTTTAATTPYRYSVATAAQPTVAIFDQPGSAPPTRELANPLPSGAPLTFLVRQERDAWLEVYLPVRPNGTVGWVRADQVAVAGHDFRIEVKLSEHTLTVYDGDELITQEPVGVGKEPTPTPGGVFYLLELIESEDPVGAYGPYAFGLSGFSEELTSFGTGDGRLGLHGTDQPDLVGSDVSAGCLRLTNEAIDQLARTLPLGTPVVILP